MQIGQKGQACLHPHPWRLDAPAPPPPRNGASPLLLLIHCRDSLPTPGREALCATLSPGERKRHDTYRRPADQARYLMARACLRQLLGHWLKLPPGAITLETSPHGKPRCPTPGAPAFNLSHSGDLILLAFHAAMDVGVDVEQSRPDLDWLPIAQRVLAPQEVSALKALPTADQTKAFLVSWCRLEARLKARGMGLAGLEQLREAESGVGGSHPTLLWDVGVPEGYTAAVALHGPGLLRALGGVGAEGCPPGPLG